MKIESKKRGILELVLLVVVFIAVWIFLANNFIKERRITKERKLSYQLAELRSGVNTYFLIKRQYPKNLAELSATTFRFPGDVLNRYYVEPLVINEEGEALDPFGNPYAYNDERGLVMSQTKGYSFW